MVDGGGLNRSFMAELNQLIVNVHFWWMAAVMVSQNGLIIPMSTTCSSSTQTGWYNLKGSEPKPANYDNARASSWVLKDIIWRLIIATNAVPKSLCRLWRASSNWYWRLYELTRRLCDFEVSWIIQHKHDVCIPYWTWLSTSSIILKLIIRWEYNERCNVHLGREAWHQRAYTSVHKTIIPLES